MLKNKICFVCNQKYGDAIDKPFLRHVSIRDIQKKHGMKRRHPNTDLKVTGSGVIVRYETIVAHLFECVKIAFETHIKFLGEEYRDDLFNVLRSLLLSIIEDYDNLQVMLKNQEPHGRSMDEVWAETWQSRIFSKYVTIINQNIFRLDEVTENPAEIITEIESRRVEGSYASLIQLSCWNFGVAVMICLQSLSPLVIRVCNQKDRYIRDFGHGYKQVMDLRSAEKLVSSENFL